MKESAQEQSTAFCSSETAYDETYRDWKGWHRDNFAKLAESEEEYFLLELEKSKRTFIKQSKVLEIGFGSGKFLALGKKMNWNITGVELNNDLIEIAKDKGFRVLHGDELGTLENGSFDLIVAIDVLEHIPQETLLDFLRVIKSKMKEGGCFVARFPNGDSPFGLKNQNGDVTHVTALGSRKATYFANRLGLEVLFIGKQASAIKTKSYAITARRVAAALAQNIVNSLVRLIFFNGEKVEFCSQNLVLVCRKRA